MILHPTISVYDPKGLRERLAFFSIFMVVFVIAQYVGYSTRYGVDSISVIWPPMGIFGVTLALCRRRHWIPLLVLMLLLDMLGSLIIGDWIIDQKQAIYLCMKILVNPLTGVIFALIVQSWVRQGDPLSSPRDFFVYVFVAICLNVLVVSLVGWVVIAMIFDDISIIASWQQWSYSDITALLSFATPVLVLVHRPELLVGRGQRRGEAALLLLVFAVATYILFAHNHETARWIEYYQLIVLLPLFAWAIAHFGPVMMTMMSSILAMSVLLGLASGRGPFDSETRTDAENVLVAQGVLVPGVLCLLYISSLLEGRRRQYEHQLKTEQRMRRLDRLDTIGTMAAGVAHDFGNLAIAIRAYQATLRSQITNPTPPVREAISGLGEIADGTQSLTRSLMNFAREEDGEMPQRVRLADLCASVSSCALAMRPLLSRRHEVVVSVPDEEMYVKATSGDLQRMLSNLLINASDASDRGTKIEITVQRMDDHAELKIKDQGQGMSPEVRARVLDPFYTTKPRGKGTGLGLSVVSGVVTEMGGTIDIDSSPGKGTTITISVPIVENPVGSESDDQYESD